MLDRLTTMITRTAARSRWVPEPPCLFPWILYGFRRSSAGPCVCSVQNDLTYYHSPDGPLKADLYRAAGANHDLQPGVLLIHGGGWAVGSKAMHRGLGRLLATHGFVAAAVDYRLTGTAPWPACLDDCRAALDWLRQSAQALGLDPARLALLGDSAGAHLAALLGLEASRTSSPVRGVVAYFGPFELTAPALRGWPRRCQEQLLGGPLANPRAAALAEAISPARLIAPGAPPFLLIHGRIDQIVPAISSELMAGALTRAGTAVETIWVEGADHGLFSLGRIRPGLVDLDRAMIGFLKKVML